MPVAFDTLAVAERLKAGGFTEQQAKAATEAFAAATSQELVTKIDLERTETRLEGEIAAVRADIERLEGRVARVEQQIVALRADLDGKITALRTEIDQKLAGLENRLLTRLGGMMAAGFAILGVLVALFGG